MKKQINNIEKLIMEFPSFKLEQNTVCPCCDNCIGENCLIENPTPFMAICSNYKFSENK
jgi:hypothetical protein